MNTLNVEQLETFVKLFSSYSPDYEKEVFNYFFLTHNGKNETVTGYGNLSGNLEDIIRHAKEVGLRGSLHIQINKAKEGSRKTSDVMATRVLLLDLDTPHEREEVLSLIKEIKPHFIVESSPKKYHFYWQVEELPLNHWQSLQLGLAVKYKGDTNLSQLAKTIRVAGIPRFDKNLNGYLPEIKYIANEVYPLGFKYLRKYFGEDLYDDILNVSETYLKKSDKTNKKIELTARYDKEIKDPKLLAKKVLESINLETFSGRNSFVYDIAKTFIYNGHAENSVKALIKEINNNFTVLNLNPLDSEELKITITNGINKGKELLSQKEESLKEKLTSIKTPTESTEPNNLEENSTEDFKEDKPDYAYNYGTRDLKFNRFSDIAITDRLLQRYGTHIVRTGKLLYAFDETNKVWRSQKGSKEVLHTFCVDSLRDTVLDPEFQDTYGMDSKGRLNYNKLKTAQERFLSHKKIGSTLYDILESNKIKRKEIHEFDDNNELLYCENGVVNMLTGEVREPKAEDYLLHQTKIKYKEEEKCTWWEEYLNEVFFNSKEPEKLVKFMQELFGYTLAGGIDEQKIFIHWGTGCNGKSKVLDTLSLLGGEYSSRLTCNSLTKSKGAIQKEIERLGVKFEGKRVVIIDDLDTATQWNEGLIKGLTSKTLLSRRLYEEEKDIPNRSKVHIGCNQAPSPEAENYGILRRLCIIPYLRTFPQNSRVEGLIAREVAKGKSGILNWAIEGYRRVKEQEGIKYPRAVQTMVEEYRQEHFTLDTLIERLYEPLRDTGSSNQENWIPCKDVLEEIEDVLLQEGKDAKGISGDTIAKVLKNKMGIQSKTVYFSSHKKSFKAYPLKRVSTNS